MKFDYGDEATFIARDTAGNLTHGRCTIVTIIEVKNSEQAEVFKHPIGAVLYTVEFGDGTDKLVPEYELEALES